MIESQLVDINKDFQAGSITRSDIVNEMILTSKVEVKALQLKRTDFRKALRVMATQPDIDIDTIIKNLSELKNKTSKKQHKATLSHEDAV